MKTNARTDSPTADSKGAVLPLQKDSAFVNGKWVQGRGAAVFSVVNPADGAVLGTVPDMDAADAGDAVAAAQTAFAGWAARTGKERSALLYKWYGLIQQNIEPLARLLTAEQGKPLAESRAEIASGAASVQWFAEEAKRVYGDYIPAHKADARIIVERQPVGVVAAITPWNFPSGMITRKVAPALAAGCTVVLKPAEDTPLSALALAVLAQEAEIPAGVFNVITTSLANVAVVGAALTGDARVRKISFTGSTEIGRLLMRQAADGVKKLSLELGGNAPFIVFESADLDKAVEGALACKSRNAGQTCISANRIYVQDGIFDVFSEKFAARFGALKMGPGDQEGVVLGPMINRQGIEKVEDLLADAVAKGARIACGGKSDGRTLFYPPTVLSQMRDEMRITREEIFGPVAALYSFTTAEEVIARANDTEYGLAAYIYTRDLSQAWRVSEALEYGMVGVNEPFVATELAPFGGVKQSGIGREGGKYGLEAFTEIKYILMGGL